ncbi:effector-associated constant component EACC1 [Streptomyces coerulescens]|uniref:Uncharacterized protein n=1 Tax=Streptomyces coerulescens TaxID=29304 RepID=A0ABW0CTH1_STRCD
MEIRLTFGDHVDSADYGDNGGAEAIDRTQCVASLYRWLLSDPELRGLALVSLATDQDPHQEHMGGTLETVNVVVANALALGNLLVAVAAWRASRPRTPQVRVERDGVVVTVQDGSAETVEQILRSLGTGGSADGAGPDDAGEG